MKNTRKKYFVFDLDDTIADSYSYNQDMFVNTFSPHIDITGGGTEKYLRDLHLKNRGKSMFDQFKIAVEYLKLDILPDVLMKENEELHKQNITSIKLFDAASNFITKLSDLGFNIAVLSNRQTESLTKLLAKSGLLNKLTKVVSCTDAGFEKPDPYCLNQLIYESGKNKDEFIYFGDSLTDAEFAKAAGVDFLIVDQYINQKSCFDVLMKLSF